jgi:hypothetical protein
MTISFYRRGVLTAVAFCVVFAGLMALHADLYLGVLLWSLIVTASIFTVARNIWHFRSRTYSLADLMPDAVRRWMLDERRDH